MQKPTPGFKPEITYYKSIQTFDYYKFKHTKKKREMLKKVTVRAIKDVVTRTKFKFLLLYRQA